jgi:hypothetical protein
MRLLVIVFILTISMLSFFAEETNDVIKNGKEVLKHLKEI